MEMNLTLKNLTLDEKIRLLNGVGSWTTYSANGKLPVLTMSDGPHGLRKQDEESYSDINRSKVATCFPTASCLASSWNRETVADVAKAIGEEAVAENVDIVLGCGLNIKRSPLCGRNFEYFSEDPFLSGELASSYVNGLQSKGRGASIKHFAANSQEKRRQTSDSIIDERALREIYLYAFEKAVKQSDPATVMESYNKLNGEYVSRSHRLLQEILRDEWGFKGAVVSDWGAAINIAECIKGGLDLAMPDSCGFHTDELKAALAEGRITEADIDRAVEKILGLIERLKPEFFGAGTKGDVGKGGACSTAADGVSSDTSAVKKKPGISSELFEKAHEIARKAACDSAVLLKNDGMFPIRADETPSRTVVIIGEMARTIRFQGGGSSHITTQPITDAVRALEGKGFKVLYEQGYSEELARAKKEALNEAEKLAAAAVELAQKAAAEKIPVLFFCGLTDRFEGEGFDRETLDIPKEQSALIARVINTGASVAAVTFSGSPIAMPFAKDVKAILHMYLAGEASAEACADLVTGDANPSGKLAETFLFSPEDVPCARWFAKETDTVEYRESIFTGYRYYETFGVPVQFEFGFGLSYTTFAYSDLNVSEPDADGNVTVSLTVKNTGNVAGKETVQIYVIPPETGIIRSKIELKGFVKEKLAPGESKWVCVTLDKRSFSVYSTEKRDFVVPEGDYTVAAAASVKDIRLQATVHVSGVTLPSQKADFPSYFPPAALENSSQAANGAANENATFGGNKNDAYVERAIAANGVGSASPRFDVPREEFAKLYSLGFDGGRTIPVHEAPQKGQFTLESSFAMIMEKSRFVRAFFWLLERVLYFMNRGKPKDDPSVKIVIQGVKENPLESLISTSNGALSAKFLRFLVRRANR